MAITKIDPYTTNAQGQRVLPSFSIGYIFVLLTSWGLRLEYSRFMFLTGFALCLA